MSQTNSYHTDTALHSSKWKVFVQLKVYIFIPKDVLSDIMWSTELIIFWQAGSSDGNVIACKMENCMRISSGFECVLTYGEMTTYNEISFKILQMKLHSMIPIACKVCYNCLPPLREDQIKQIIQRVEVSHVTQGNDFVEEISMSTVIS